MIRNTMLDYQESQGSDEYIFEYNILALPSGLYFLVLETPYGSQVRKLIVE